MKEEIDFPAIYKDLDKQEARKKLMINILSWIAGIILLVIVLGMAFGYIDTKNCGEIKPGDIECIPRF